MEKDKIILNALEAERKALLALHQLITEFISLQVDIPKVPYIASLHKQIFNENYTKLQEALLKDIPKHLDFSGEHNLETSGDFLNDSLLEDLLYQMLEHLESTDREEVIKLSKEFQIRLLGIQYGVQLSIELVTRRIKNFNLTTKTIKERFYGE